MKKSKKQLILSIAACAMALSMAVGGTMAYMTDSETATNTVTVGKVSIDLEESNYPGNITITPMKGGTDTKAHLCIGRNSFTLSVPPTIR